jgi:exodeoxyribonuclease VII large subunit
MSITSSTAAPGSNNPELTVSELSGAIKRALEDRFDRVRLRGEVSGFKGPSASGHVYFGLKDATAKIDAVIWKGVFGRLPFRLEEGMDLIAVGKVSSFPGSSRYQIIIDQIELAGEGAMLAELERRRQRLKTEGLFDPSRKRPLPYLPRVIGVVTSPTGSVIRDIIHRVRDRFPVHILVWPVRVQGEASAAEVAAAIRGFNALPEDGVVPRPDVLIVARGGGSLEDLWGFNDEAVVRATAASRIPLISSIGHETDTTLIDYAADLRAPTPTAAAEFAVPVRSELLATTGDLGQRLRSALHRLVERRRTELRSAARALPQPESFLALPRQRLDMSAARLPEVLKAAVSRRRLRLAALSQKLEQHSPRTDLAKTRERFEQIAKRLPGALARRMDLARDAHRQDREKIAKVSIRLTATMERVLKEKRRALAHAVQLLDSVSHQRILDRGFALVLDQERRPVRQKKGLSPRQQVSLAFADGEVSAMITGDAIPAPARARSLPAASAPDLFDRDSTS